MGDEPRALDRRRFLKRAALGVADALETAARYMGAPGLGSPGPARDRERLDQPEDGAEDPCFCLRGGVPIGQARNAGRIPLSIPARLPDDQGHSAGRTITSGASNKYGSPLWSGAVMHHSVWLGDGRSLTPQSPP